MSVVQHSFIPRVFDIIFEITEAENGTILFIFFIFPEQFSEIRYLGMYRSMGETVSIE